MCSENTRPGSLTCATLAQSPIGRSSLYFGSTAEFISIIRQNKIGDPTSQANVSRIDDPTAVGRLPFLNMTLSGGYRFTSWNKQVVAQKLVETRLQRQLFDLRADVTGPTVMRIFDTPGNGYATRWKHLIQPTFSLSRDTAFPNFKAVPQNDYTDLIVGGVTSATYGLANRLLAKRPAVDGRPAVAQEIASIQVQQTDHSNALRALSFDTTYESAPFTASKFSPVSIRAAVAPITEFSSSMRVSSTTTSSRASDRSAGATASTPNSRQWRPDGRDGSC